MAEHGRDQRAVTQNDLIRLALHRLRKDLGAASRIKPEIVLATAKASKYKLTPPRTAGAAVPAAGWDVLTIVAAISVCSSGGSLPKRCDSGRRRTPVGAIGVRGLGEHDHELSCTIPNARRPMPIAVVRGPTSAGQCANSQAPVGCRMCSARFPMSATTAAIAISGSVYTT